MKEEIIKLRKNGLTINEIVKELKCAKSTVSYHINKAGLGCNNTELLYGITKNKIDMIKKLRLDGKTYVEILELVDVSDDKLRKICRILNLNQSINNIKSNLVTREMVIDSYNKTKSKKKTAKILHISYNKLKELLSDYQLPIQKKSKAQAVIDWRKRKKEELVHYKGGCCERCGYNKSFGALQFHHINPDEKDFIIGGKSYSIERLKKEADKCILVCANCHIEIHEELRNK